MALLALAMTSADAGPVEPCAPPPGWNEVAARGTRYVVFGELHGTRQAPALIGDVACTLAIQGERLLVAVELSADNDAALQRAWAQPDERFADALFAAWPARRDDGVGSEAMAALLRRLHRLRAGGRTIDIVAFNGTQPQEARFAGLPGQGPHEAAQADNIRRADAGRYDHVLVLTGNVHAGKQPLTRGNVTFEPMAMRLAPASAVTSLDMKWSGGTFWGCLLREGHTFVPGKPLADGAIDCSAHSTKASASIPRSPLLGLGTAPGARPAPAYDGWFWLGRVTASPPYRPFATP